MNEERVETGVDRLIDLLESSGKISITDASQKLNIPEDTIQLWVDFLVEEHILGVEYKFTKPYIFLNENTTKKIIIEEQEQQSIENFKENFFKDAKNKKIPEQQISLLWQNHLSSAIEKKKDFFLREAKKKKLQNPEKLFDLYAKRLLTV